MAHLQQHHKVDHAGVVSDEDAGGLPIARLRPNAVDADHAGPALAIADERREQAMYRSAVKERPARQLLRWAVMVDGAMSEQLSRSAS